MRRIATKVDSGLDIGRGESTASDHGVDAADADRLRGSAATVTEADRRAVRTEQFAAASRGELHMVVHELLPLEQAGPAHQKMDAGEVFGRIVLTPS